MGGRWLEGGSVVLWTGACRTVGGRGGDWPVVTNDGGDDDGSLTVSFRGPWLGKSLTCRRHVGPTAKSRHIWPTGPQRADTNSFPTLFFCRRLPTFSKFSPRSRVRMYAQPAKNLYIQRRSILSTIHRAVVDNNNTQQPT